MDVYGANSGLINSGGDSIANIQKLFSNIASACGVHANSPPVTAMDKKIAAFVEGYKMNPTTDLLHFLRIELNSLGSEGSLKDLKAFGQMQMQHQNFKEASPAEQALFKNICGC